MWAFFIAIILFELKIFDAFFGGGVNNAIYCLGSSEFFLGLISFRK